jgi:hypothetical protein
LFIRTTVYVEAELGYDLMILVKHRKEANFTRPNPPEQAVTVKTKARADNPLATSTAESTTQSSTTPSPTSTAESRINTETRDDKSKAFVTSLGHCTVAVKG